MGYPVGCTCIQHNLNGGRDASAVLVKRLTVMPVCKIVFPATMLDWTVPVIILQSLAMNKCVQFLSQFFLVESVFEHFH